MKTYWLSVGDSSVNPPTYSGLSPTITLFVDSSGSTAIPPGITEAVAGSGAYSFQYGPTIGMFMTVDWGISVPAGYRYTKGGLDPIQAVDERVGGIVDNNDSIGTTSTNPSTVIGFLKRLQEFNEGDALYLKATGQWYVYSRGASVLLAEKDLTNTITSATKS